MILNILAIRKKFFAGIGGVANEKLKSYFFICLMCLLLLISSKAEASEWFETEGADCSGLISLGEAFYAIIGKNSSVNKGSGAANYYLTLQAEMFSKLLNDKVDLILNITALNSYQAKNLRKIVANRAEKIKVPTFVTMSTSITTGLLLTPVSGTASGLLTSFFYDKINASAYSFKEASMFIADGGEVYRRLSLLERQDGSFFVSSTAEYRVNVGNEIRNFFYYGCIYPVSVIVVEFRTKGQYNNKIIRNTHERTWRIWDITDKKYHVDSLIYKKQDKGYYYFMENEEEHRISFTGGPWQIKRDNKFKTLYAIVEPKG